MTDTQDVVLWHIFLTIILTRLAQGIKVQWGDTAVPGVGDKWVTDTQHNAADSPGLVGLVALMGGALGPPDGDLGDVGRWRSLFSSTMTSAAAMVDGDTYASAAAATADVPRLDSHSGESAVCLGPSRSW